MMTNANASHDENHFVIPKISEIENDALERSTRRKV